MTTLAFKSFFASHVMAFRDVSADYGAFLAAAEGLALSAGKMLREGFYSHVKAAFKADNSVVTELDVKVETFLKERLLALFPEHDVLGEEKGSEGNEGAEFRWVIDPLDGTNNFSRHIPFFNVSIALEKRLDSANDSPEDKGASEGWEVVVGAVYNPLLDELFSAVKGRGAFFNGIAFKQPLPNEEGRRFFGFCHGRTEAVVERVLRIFSYYKKREADIRKFGSAALEISYVARGHLDAFVGYGLKLWDFRAAELIARESGTMAKPESYEGEPFILVAHLSIYGGLYEEVIHLLEKG